MLPAWLARGRGARTAYLSMTRGDGGQNLIGTETGEALGVIRTQELLAARRIDGAEQFFTRALDFGFSKNADETLEIWGHERILADVVWVIRRFRPDVIVTRFGTDGSGGHGHHTASAILADEAFRAAADSTKFPEQLARVNVAGEAAGVERLGAEARGTSRRHPSCSRSTSAPTTRCGASYTEIAGAPAACTRARASARRSAADRSPTTSSRWRRAAERDLFEGVDLTWTRIPGGGVVDSLLRGPSARSIPSIPPASCRCWPHAGAMMQRWRAPARIGHAWSRSSPSSSA